MRLNHCTTGIALFALLSLLTLLGYQFGTGHQTEQLPLILRQLEPGFIERDFYTNHGSDFGPRYYYVQLIAGLASVWNLPAVFLALTLVVNFALAAITYLAARDLLGADRLAGQIAAVIAVTNSGFSLGLASYIRFENLRPASPAIAISLFALWCGIRGRPIWAALLAGTASLFHPLIGLEIGALALGCAGARLVVERRFARSASAGAPEAMRWAGGVLVLAAMAYVLWIAPMPDPQGDRLTSEELFELLVLYRAPHHYLPSTMPISHYLAFSAYLVSLLGIWWLWYRSEDRSHSPPDQNRSRSTTAVVVLLPVLGIVLVCALSYVFLELAHSRLWIIGQPFRMLYVVKWIGVLFIAWWASRLFRSGDPVEAGIAVLALLSSAQAHPIVLLLCFGAWLLLRTGGVRLSSSRWRWGALGGLALLATLLNLKAGAIGEIIMIGAGLLCVYFLGRGDPTRPRALIVPASAVVGLILFALLNRSGQWLDLKAFKPSLTIEGLQGPPAEIAKWARRSTPADSIWLVPPEFRGFRVVAERAVVVDFTCMPFGDGAMRAWQERMRASYGDVGGGGFVALAEMQRNHEDLTPERALDVSRRFGASHAVLYRQTPWPGQVLYANEEFKAVRLVPPEDASSDR